MLGIVGVALAALGAGAPGISWAQGAYAYPKAGQSKQQQQKDQSDCRGWAVDQTGFDPSRQQTYVVQGSSAPPPSSSGGIFGRGDYGEGGGLADAGKGAGLGAIGGAIAGNAGAGAAIGALSGLFIGSVKRSNQQAERDAWERQQAEQRRQQEQQIAAQDARGRSEYERAFGACMRARGYQVQ
jgi:hypothetical protein